MLENRLLAIDGDTLQSAKSHPELSVLQKVIPSRLRKGGMLSPTALTKFLSHFFCSPQARKKGRRPEVQAKQAFSRSNGG